MKLPHKEDGLWIYDEKPDEVRQATLEDFVLLSGKARVGFDFLVHSSVSDHYEAHYADKHSLGRWFKYIVAGRIYVKDKEHVHGKK